MPSEPLKRTAPAPSTTAVLLNVWEPPSNVNTAPWSTRKLPLARPPLDRLSAPLRTRKLPLLLNTIGTLVIPEPADLTNVPRLLNDPPPLPRLKDTSARTSNVPWARLFHTALLRMRISVEPAQVVLPPLSTVRPSSNLP